VVGVDLQLEFSGTARNLYAGTETSVELDRLSYEAMVVAPKDPTSQPSVNSQIPMLPDFDTVFTVVFVGILSRHDQEEYCGYGFTIDGIPGNKTFSDCKEPFIAARYQKQFVVIGEDKANSLIKKGNHVDTVYLEYTNVDADTVKELAKAKYIYSKLDTPAGKAIFLSNKAKDQREDIDNQDNVMWLILFVILIIVFLTTVIGVGIYVYKSRDKSFDV
jgi:hypothetical protein